MAERLGISAHSLYEWIKKYGPANGVQAGRLANKDDEIRRLRTELKRVTEERKILKKAAAYFAKSSGKGTHSSGITGTSFGRVGKAGKGLKVGDRIKRDAIRKVEGF